MYLRATASVLQRHGDIPRSQVTPQQEQAQQQQLSRDNVEGGAIERRPPLHIDTDEAAAVGDDKDGADHSQHGSDSRERNARLVSLPFSSLLSCVLPAAVVNVLCPLPAPTPALFSAVPLPLSPGSAASFLPSTLTLSQAVRRCRYHDVLFFIQHGADVAESESAAEGDIEHAESEESDSVTSSPSLSASSGLTLTDELMRAALRAGRGSLAGGSGSTWPAILLLLLEHGAPTDLSAALTPELCGLPSSSDGQLTWSIWTTRFLAILQVALALLQQRHKDKLQQLAASKSPLLATHQQRQEQLVDALTQLQLDEEKEGRERNRQTATKVRYQMMARKLRELESSRQRRREEQLTLREADIRAAYEERGNKLRALLAEIDRVRAEDRKLGDEVELRRQQLHDTTSEFDAWLKQRQSDQAELLRLERETAAMEEEIRTARRQREEVRQLRGSTGQLRMRRQRVSVECGAGDVQFVMENKRKKSHLFFRFHRAHQPSSSAEVSQKHALQFEAEPCVESPVFPSAAALLPPSASSLSNPSWPPVSVDVFSLCGGDESVPFRVFVCDGESASSTARTATVRSTAGRAVSPSRLRYVSASSAVVTVAVCEVSVGQLRRSGGGGVHVMMRSSEAPDAPLAGVFHFISVEFSDER